MIERKAEIEPHNLTIGVVLTAGWENFEGKLFIPNAEGRIRTQSALIDVKHNLIDQIAVAGGARTRSGLKYSTIYREYMQKQLREHGRDDILVYEFPGGSETGSDLRSGIKDLSPNIGLRVYTTSFHQGRVALILRSLSHKATLINAERLVAQESQEGAKLVKYIFHEGFLKEMYQREEMINNILGVLDHNPFIPFAGKIRLGSRLIEMRASNE